MVGGNSDQHLYTGEIDQTSAIDQQLIYLWVIQYPPQDREYYWQIAVNFANFVGKPLIKVTEKDINKFARFYHIWPMGGRRPGIIIDQYRQQQICYIVTSLIKFGWQTGLFTQVKSQKSHRVTPSSLPARKLTSNWQRVAQLPSKFWWRIGISTCLFFSLGWLTPRLLGFHHQASNNEFIGFSTSIPMPDVTNNVRANPVNNPKVRAFLDTIAVMEGTTGPDGYYMQYTGTKIQDLSKHPEEMRCGTDIRNNKLCSDAAGRYQFLSTSWKLYGEAIGVKDFSPTNQDLVAIEIIRSKEALTDIEEGRLESAFVKLAFVWPSFTKNRTVTVEALMPKLISVYQTNLSRYYNTNRPEKPNSP